MKMSYFLNPFDFNYENKQIKRKKVIDQDEHPVVTHGYLGTESVVRWCS